MRRAVVQIETKIGADLPDVEGHGVSGYLMKYIERSKTLKKKHAKK